MDGSNPTDESTAELLALIRDARITTYAVLASLVFLLFDYFLTIGQEISFVWKSQFRWGKVLFLILRYAGLLSHTFNSAVYLNNTASSNCLMALRFQTGSSNVVLWLVEISLAVRVWLLYSRSRVVLVGLSALYICSISTVIAISATALFHGKGAVVPRPGPFLPGCYTNIPSYYSYVVLLPIFTTTVLLVLTVYKTAQAMNSVAEFQKPIMISLLLRDGVLYFSSVIVVLIINLLVFKFARPTMASFASGFLVAVPYVAGSRSFLNVREKLLRPNPNITILETLSTFELRGYEIGDNATEGFGFEMDALALRSGPGPTGGGEIGDHQHHHQLHHATSSTSIRTTQTQTRMSSSGCMTDAYVEPDSAATLVASERAPWV